MFSNNTYKSIDKLIIFAIFSLLGIGYVMIATALGLFLPSYSIDEGIPREVIMQFMWIVLAVVVLMSTLAFDYTMLKENVVPLYIFNFLLLIVVLIPGIGVVHGGARRWIEIGPFGGQPSEIAKLVIVIVTAYLLDKHYDSLNQPVVVLKIVAIAAAPVALIFNQPHLSASIIIFSIIVAQLFIAGVSLKYFLGTGVVGMLLSYPIYRFVLEDYQRTRILALLYPEKYTLTNAFQTKQSVTAIGSGMQFGYRVGSNAVNVPEGHTDFIFSVISSQWGFVGSTIIILLFLLLVYRCVIIAFEAKTRFESFMVIGIAAMWGFQAFFNMGVTLGILPNTGVPLPFVSYGGSSLLIQMIGVGLVLKVAINNQKTMF